MARRGKASQRFLAGPALVTAAEMRASAELLRIMHGEERAVPHDRYDTAGLPFVSFETWAMIRNGCTGQHNPTSCPACAYYRQVDRDHYAAPWLKRHRVQVLERPRWASAEEALRYFVAVTMDGYPSLSMAATLLAYNELGCWASTGQRKGNAAERAADDVALVERALRWAFRAQPEPLRCRAILLCRRGVEKPADADFVAGRAGVDVDTVRAVVRIGMHGVRVELGARGAIPLPSRREPRVLEATLRRIEEIGR